MATLIAIRPESLIEARYNLTSKENDIIDMMLNTIKEDDQFIYEIDLDKYKEIYDKGATNVYRDLKKASKDLFDKHNKFYIKDKSTGKEYNFVWFSMIEYQDKEAKIKFEVGDTLKKLLLEMKKRIYYKLEYTMKFRSTYSKRIYYLLKSFEDTGWRIDRLDDLQHILDCPDSYKLNYGLFDQKVLSVAKSEINENSDLSFDYTPIKTGKKVTNIKFSIRSDYRNNKNNTKLSVIDDEVSVTLDETLTSLIEKFKAIVEVDLSNKKIIEFIKAADNNFDLIKRNYEYMKSQSDIRDPKSWLLKAIKNDYAKDMSNAKESKYKNQHKSKGQKPSSDREYTKDELDIIFNNTKEDRIYDSNLIKTCENCNVSRNGKCMFKLSMKNGICESWVNLSLARKIV